MNSKYGKRTRVTFEVKLRKLPYRIDIADPRFLFSDLGWRNPPIM